MPTILVVIKIDRMKKNFKHILKTLNIEVVCLCFFLLRPLQNQAIVTSQCMHYIFCRGRKVKHTDESVLPVKKRRGNEPSALG